MTRLDFTFLTSGNLATNIVHPGLNVIDYYRARLILRIHEISMVPTQTLKMAAFGTNPSQQDPRTFALNSASLSVAITSSTSAGTLVTDDDTDLLPYLMIMVIAEQGAATGGQSLFAVLSADLLLREA